MDLRIRKSFYWGIAAVVVFLLGEAFGTGGCMTMFGGGGCPDSAFGIAHLGAFISFFSILSGMTCAVISILQAKKAGEEISEEKKNVKE